MSLVIGEFENRRKAVPVTFSSENLDIRHRLPDRMGQGAANFGQRQSTYVGVSKPQTGAYRSKASVTSLPAGSEVEVSGKAEF